jgi:hypothetical protein
MACADHIVHFKSNRTRFIFSSFFIFAFPALACLPACLPACLQRIF